MSKLNEEQCPSACYDYGPRPKTGPANAGKKPKPMSKDETDAAPVQERDKTGHGKRRRKRKPSRVNYGVNGNTRHVSKRNQGRKPKKDSHATPASTE